MKNYNQALPIHLIQVVKATFYLLKYNSIRTPYNFTSIASLLLSSLSIFILNYAYACNTLTIQQF